MISVLIIDNAEQIKPIVSDSIADLSLYIDEIQALNAIENKQPSVVLLNYAVREEETADYIKLILKVSIDCKIVVIANELSQENILNCLIAGAKGYQEINQLSIYADKLIKVIDAGEAWITRRMVAILLEILRS
jgi:DNA-binding NarL/FixJ family response regulator